jgi:hypothetical protein
VVITRQVRSQQQYIRAKLGNRMRSWAAGRAEEQTVEDVKHAAAWVESRRGHFRRGKISDKLGEDHLSPLHGI